MISDEEARAVQELAKASGHAISAAEKAGGFFSRVFGQPIEDTVGRFWGDPVRASRLENAIELSIRTQAKLKNSGVKILRPVTLSVGVPLIEAASLESDETLKDMWSNLLASAVNPDSEGVDKSFVKTLDLLTPKTAVFLKWLWDNRKKDAETDQTFSYELMRGQVKYTEHDIRSLIRFGIVDSTYRELSLEPRPVLPADTDSLFWVSNGIEEFEFTEFGYRFGESVIKG